MAAKSATRKLYESLTAAIRKAGRLDLLVFPIAAEPMTRRCLHETGERRCWRPRGHGYGGMYCERHGAPHAPGWTTYVTERTA